MFDVMPPLVNAPSDSGNPISWATHASAWASTRSAARAVAARFTS